ncbi:M56 family metallopeptidase [Neobacillus ginsengisoli]|uniref:Zn-dependent protease with chaperone function n=1 Tax=Neobacillus ginsengisoli TaxID=904295 RepID=A0ABT9XTS8_9BACI|nr:M56 family metallopeptidase [Neobacillus ginsengisoli]MDQ0198962.1 Zn-dependent protease with chaperone function [Neobacillus ginsengisoli]
MLWRNKSFFVLGVGLCFGMVLCIQLGLYLANILFGPTFFDNIFQFCIRIFKKGTVEYYVVLLLVNTYVVFSILVLCKKIIQQVVNTNRLKKKIGHLTNREKTIEMNQRFNRSGRDIIVINSNELIALTFGLRNPFILLSTNLIKMLDKTELEAVIYHETAHQKYHDTLKIFVLKMIYEVMWYIPLTKWAYKNFKIIIELVADEYAITRMGSELGLGSALLKLINTHLDYKTNSLLVPFADGTIDYRLKQLIEPYYTLPFKLQIKSIIISVNVMILSIILMIIV